MESFCESLNYNLRQLTRKINFRADLGPVTIYCREHNQEKFKFNFMNPEGSRKRIVFCYTSCYKENEGIDVLYGPLSLAYLARHTPDQFELELVDEYVGEDLDAHRVAADIVAFSSLSSGINRTYALAEILRQRGILTVLGGAHASALPEEAIQHVDVVIRGEGEGPWKTFLEDFENGTWKEFYHGRMDVSLDGLGIPDRNFIHHNYPYPSLMTSRGCPFSCTFCYLSVYPDREYRTIPHETVLQDMESLRGERIVVITDENFIGYSDKDYKNRKSLLRKMADRKFGFYWGCQASVNIAGQPELLDLMYEAGCRIVFIGYETIDNEGLKSLNKKQNVALDYREVIRNIHKKKIAVISSVILGLDNHKPGYHLQLIRELRRIRTDLVRVFFMTAWPGTPLYRQMEEEGRVSKEWDLLRKDIPSLKFSHYTSAEIIEARSVIMKAFFSRNHVLRLAVRWMFIDRSLIGMLFRIWWRSITSEKIRTNRAYEVVSAGGG